MTGDRLLTALVRAQPETVNLVLDGQKDLQVLRATDGDLATFAAGLASFTGELSTSNAQLQALIRNARGAEDQLNPLLAADSTQIAGTIAGLAAGAHASSQFQAGVQALFRLLPVASSELASVAAGGSVHGVLEVNTADTVCPYVLGAQMPGPTQAVATPALSNTCTTSRAGHAPARGGVRPGGVGRVTE